MIRLHPEGHDRGRRRPVLLSRVRAGMVGPLFEEPGAFDRAALAARLRALAERGTSIIGGSSWKYEGWLGQVYTRERYLSRGRFSRAAVRSRVPARIRRDVPHRVRRFRLLPVPHRGILAQAVRAHAARASVSPSKCRNRSPARCFPAHARYGPQAGKENEAFLDAAHARREMFLRPAAAVPREDGAADLRIRRLRHGALSRSCRSSWTGWTRSWPRCRRNSATPWRSAIPSFWRGTISPACAATAWRTSTTRGRSMPELRHQIGDSGFRHRRFSGVPRAAAPRAGVRRSGGALRAVHAKFRIPTRKRATRCAC